MSSERSIEERLGDLEEATSFLLEQAELRAAGVLERQHRAFVEEIRARERRSE